MDVLVSRLGEAVGLAEAQRGALLQAQAYFDERVRALGTDEEKTADQVRADLERTAEDNPDDSRSARIAMSCLWALQEGT
jgi:hypothetical protein